MHSLLSVSFQARGRAAIAWWRDARRLAVWSVLLAWLPAGTPAHALETVSLQLRFYHQFQFAGYDAAIEKGYFRDAGLDVRLLEGAGGNDTEAMVLSGKAQYGVGNSALVVGRSQGQPVVVLGVIFQHSPFVLIAAQTTSTQAVHDLVGKRVMIAEQFDELVSCLKKEGVPLSSLQRVEHSFNPDDLVTNSIKHGFEGRSDGRIRIAATARGDLIELVYEDNGHGIAAELQHRVFEPFHTTKLGQGGSGLGMSIVHNLTHAIFKGRVRLESAPEQGLRLIFLWPAVTPEAQPVPPAAAGRCLTLPDAA